MTIRNKYIYIYWLFQSLLAVYISIIYNNTILYNIVHAFLGVIYIMWKLFEYDITLALLYGFGSFIACYFAQSLDRM